MKSSHVEISYRHDIDGLRAIAVSVVVLFHAKFKWFQGGFVGVDVFFVISGFLITSLLLKEVRQTQDISFLRFYSKRLKRLFPSMAVVILATSLIWALLFLGRPNETESFVKSIKYAIFGIGNIYFARNTGGYFDPSNDEVPLLHFWSLGVEEQFYLVWPFLIWASFYFFKANRKKTQKNLTLIIGSISLLSLMLSHVLYLQGKNNEVFYWMPFRAWELGAGALLALYSSPEDKVGAPKKEFDRLFYEIASVLGLALIFYSVFFFAENNKIGLSMFVPVSGAWLLVFAGASKENRISKLLSTKIMVLIGKLSYGIYLWHWPILSLTIIWNGGDELNTTTRLLAIIGSLLLSWLTFTFIETPFRSGQSFIKKLNERSVIITSLAFSFAVVQISRLIIPLEAETMTKQEALFSSLIRERSPISMKCLGNIDLIRKGLCTINNSSPKGHIVVWGDSHANALFPMIEEFISNKPIKATLYSNSSTVPLIPESNVFFGSELIANSRKNFSKFVINDLKKIIEREKNVTVLLSARWMGYTGKFQLGVEKEKEFIISNKVKKNIASLSAGLEMTIKKLNELGVNRIVVVLPNVEFKYHVSYCAKMVNSNRCRVTVEDFTKYRQDTVKAIKTAVTGFELVKIIDPADYFCDSVVCNQIKQEGKVRIPIVYDKHHTSVVAAKGLGRFFQKELNWLFPE